MNTKKIIVAIVVVGVVATAANFLVNQNSGDNGGVACTMEALLCPDGSAVGRGGSQCKFSACPQQASLTGTLKQDANGFRLILPSPENGGEVTYSLPLVIKVSNVLGQLVDQKVRVYGSFTEGATYSVDRLEELSESQGDPTLGEVAIGKTVFINGVQITLNKITQDNRCPIDVQCIQAGWVTANITLQSNTDKETKDIASNAKPLAFDSYQISIEDIKPSKMAGATPTPESYLLTFRVREN